MRIRRCSVLYLEPREEMAFDLGSLLAGGDGLRREQRWYALAAHLGEEVEVDISGCGLLGRLSPSEWIDAGTLPEPQGRALPALLAAGLVIADGEAHAPHRRCDEVIRAAYWHPLAATLHAFTRWSDVDTVQNMRDSGTETALGMREVLGPPPVENAARADTAQRLPLARAPAAAFDELLARRVTCRNFDPARMLPQALFAQLLERVFAAQVRVRVSDDTVFLKKNSPSGGGLHPMEAYLVVLKHPR